MNNEEIRAMNLLITEHNLMAHFIRQQSEALRMYDKPWYLRLYYALRPMPILVPRPMVVPHFRPVDEMVPDAGLYPVTDSVPEFDDEIDLDEDPDIHATMERWHVTGKG